MGQLQPSTMSAAPPSNIVLRQHPAGHQGGPDTFSWGQKLLNTSQPTVIQGLNSVMVSLLMSSVVRALQLFGQV